MTDYQHHHDRRQSPGHEPNTVRTPYIVVGLLAIGVLMAAAVGFSYGLVRVAQWMRPSPPPADTPRIEAGQVEPSLDPDQRATLAKLRADEERILNRYEWIDQDEGVARIPIDRAIEFVAAQNNAAQNDAARDDAAQNGAARNGETPGKASEGEKNDDQ
ncbi:MAG: hypothetical protein RIC55_23640 [Pirellulaceae bacterium]